MEIFIFYAVVSALLLLICLDVSNALGVDKLIRKRVVVVSSVFLALMWLPALIFCAAWSIAFAFRANNVEKTSETTEKLSERFSEAFR